MRIAVIPQTTGTDLWEPELNGAQSVAKELNASIYWNAPTREDDVNAQIALVERLVRNRECDGIVLAPDHSLALMDAVQHAEAAGIPVVVVSSRLNLPAGPGLSYILNNDVSGGEMAAKYLGEHLEKNGTIALMGIDPDVDGVMERARSFELSLHHLYPEIKIVARYLGSYNVPHERQIAAEILKIHPQINAIIAMNSAAARGAWFSMLDANRTDVGLIGFDQFITSDDEKAAQIDAIVRQNTYEMGRMAVKSILAQIHHQPIPLETKVEPELVPRKEPRILHAHSSRNILLGVRP